MNAMTIDQISANARIRKHFTKRRNAGDVFNRRSFSLLLNAWLESGGEIERGER